MNLPHDFVMFIFSQIHFDLSSIVLGANINKMIILLKCHAAHIHNNDLSYRPKWS